MTGLYVPSEHTITHRQFLAAEPNIEILIGGQSDVKTSLAPPLIDRAAFNYADTGESPIEGYFKLKRHLPRMPRLRVVIYSLALPSFVGVRKERLYSRVYRRGQISRDDYPALRDLGVRRPALARLLAQLKFTGKSEIYAMRENLKRRLRRQPPSPPIKGVVIDGFRYQEGSRVDPDRARLMAAHHFEGDNPLDPVLLDYFEKLLRLCRDRGLTTVTVSAPVTDVYLAEAEKHVTREQVFGATVHHQRFAGLIDHHIDMTDMFADRYELFRDQNHMNVRGAEAASRHVASALGDLVQPVAAEIVMPSIS